MHYSTIALTGYLLSGASALPNGSPSAPKCQLFTDNFEDIQGATLGRGVISVYNGVTYKAFNAAAKSLVTGSTGGVIPHSGNQDIVVGVGNDVLQLGSVTLNPFGVIYATPSASFDLYSFWFGCGGNLEKNQASQSEGCDLTVVGYNIWGQQLPAQTFSYAPENPTAYPMVEALLPAYYTRLQNVTIGLANSDLTPVTTAIWMDDVTHCNYAK